MKSVQIIIPKDKTKLVLSIFSNLKIPYTKLEGEKEDIIISVLKDETVDLLTEMMKKIGVGTVFGTLQLLPLEYAAVSEEIGEKKRIPRASREEILQDIRGKAKFDVSYVTYTVTSTIIATLGLLTNNVIMIIASMLIAPLIGPIMGFSLGTTLGIRDLQKDSLVAEILGILLSIMIGVVVTAFTPYQHLTDQILLRAKPSYIDIIFALVAGLAAAISIASVETMSLIGVAIAASILPPAANVGIGLTFLVRGVPQAETVVIGSAVLLIINILAINFMSLTYFWFSGIKTTISARKKTVTKKVLIKRFITLLILMAIVSYPIVSWTQQHFNEVNTEKRLEYQIKQFVEENYGEYVGVVSINAKYDTAKNEATVEISITLKNRSFNVTSLAEQIAKYVETEFGFKATILISVYYTNYSPKRVLGYVY